MSKDKSGRAPVWYLSGPFHRYEGGADALKKAAKAAGVRLVDSRFAPADKPFKAEKVPTAKLKPEFDPELIAQAKAEKAAEAEAQANELEALKAELEKTQEALKASQDELAALKKEQAKAAKADKAAGK